MSVDPEKQKSDRQMHRRIQRPWTFWGWVIVSFGFVGLLVTQWMGIPLTTLLEHSLSRQTLLGYMILGEDPKEVAKREAAERRKLWSTRLVTGEIGGAYFEIPQNYLLREMTELDSSATYIDVTWPELLPISEKTDSRFDGRSEKYDPNGLVRASIGYDTGANAEYIQALRRLRGDDCSFDDGLSETKCTIEWAGGWIDSWVLDHETNAVYECDIPPDPNTFSLCTWLIPVSPDLFVEVLVKKEQADDEREIRDKIVSLMCSFYRAAGPDSPAELEGCKQFRETGKFLFGAAAVSAQSLRVWPLE